MSFKVIGITDADTFSVTPSWTWDGKSGNAVRPTGYNAPEKGRPGHQTATEKLERLILGKCVDLRNAIKLTYDRLLCDVYYNGKNLADYFPEYQ